MFRGRVLTRVWCHLSISRPLVISPPVSCTCTCYMKPIIAVPHRWASQAAKEARRIASTRVLDDDKDDEEEEDDDDDMMEQQDEAYDSDDPDQQDDENDILNRIGEKPVQVGAAVGGVKITDHDFEFFEFDLDETFIKGSGRGGQKVNKTNNCVRLLHRPTGTQVKCHATRSLEQNRAIARRIMYERLQLLRLGSESRHALEGERQRKKKERIRRRRQQKLEIKQVEAERPQQDEDEDEEETTISRRKPFAFQLKQRKRSILKPEHADTIPDAIEEAPIHESASSTSTPISASTSTSTSTSSPAPDPLAELEARRLARLEAKATQREERARKREQRRSIKQEKEEMREQQRIARIEQREARRAERERRQQEED